MRMQRLKLLISLSRKRSWADIVEGAITLALAAIGAGLGVINTLHAISLSRPRMRVRFSNVITDVSDDFFSIDATNLSAFPLELREVGLSLSPFWKREIHRLYLKPLTHMGSQLPCRLEPRQRADFYFAGPIDGKPPSKIRSAYVKTACLTYFRGSTPALRGMSRKIGQQ